MRRTTAMSAGLAALVLALGACGEEGSDIATAGEVQVRAVDYDFEGVPATVPSGTRLALTNASDEEFHEMVVVRIDDPQDRPLGQLIDLPPDQVRGIVRNQAVLGAMPGEDGVVLRGDATVGEPGRYGLVCFIPVGADPAAYRALVEAEDPSEVEPPEIEPGPSHASRGMFAELRVAG